MTINIQNIKKILNNKSLIFILLISYFYSTLFFLYFSGGKAYLLSNYKNLNIITFIIIYLFFFLITLFINLFLKDKKININYYLLPLSFGLYSLITTFQFNNVWYAFLLILLCYCIQNTLIKNKKMYSYIEKG